LCVI